jgi:hypothetical protein
MMNHWIEGWISWTARMDWIDLWNLWEEIPRKTISPLIFHAAKISINLIRSSPESPETLVEQSAGLSGGQRLALTSRVQIGRRI